MAGSAMDGTWLVIVTGPPGAGKTSLARPLSSRLGLPLISKDDLKEILFETLGWGDRARSRAVSDAAYELMFFIARTELAAGRSLMLEANFRPEAKERFEEMGKVLPFQVLQIRCRAERRTLKDRLIRRAEGRLRHPGHVDSDTLPELVGMIDRDVPLALAGPVIEVDTTDPLKMGVEEIAGRVQATIGGRSSGRPEF